MNGQIEIRKLNPSDAPDIGMLCENLGYSIDLDEVHKHVQSIISNDDHVAYMAVQDNQSIGFIHAFKTFRLTSKPFVEIGGLVVAESDRSKGIGKALIQYVEDTFAANEEIRVRCNVKRTSAHRFYKGLNYEEKKEQKVFYKKI